LFLVDGDPSGVIVAEIMNWSGHALLAPRSKLPEVLQRLESQRTGVYILLGDISELGGRRPAYIGESDNVGKRIGQHVKEDLKDFERFCFFTSKDFNLTKGHARYLENRISGLARESGRADVGNLIEPSFGSLPESDVADMEFFLGQIRIILPVLGYDILKAPFSQKAEKSSVVPLPSEAAIDEDVNLELRDSREGLVAKAVESKGEIIVLKGALALKDPQYAMNQYAILRQTLINDGSLVDGINDKYLEFSRDVPFSSPSAAAAVIYGRNANGRTSWLIAGSRKTLKDFQVEKAEAVL
jgi:hypothetical protein